MFSNCWPNKTYLPQCQCAMDHGSNSPNRHNTMLVDRLHEPRIQELLSLWIQNTWRFKKDFEVARFGAFGTWLILMGNKFWWILSNPSKSIAGWYPNKSHHESSIPVVTMSKEKPSCPKWPNMWSFLFNHHSLLLKQCGSWPRDVLKANVFVRPQQHSKHKYSKTVRFSQEIYPVIFKAYKTRMLPKHEERPPLQKSDLPPVLPDFSVTFVL